MTALWREDDGYVKSVGCAGRMVFGWANGLELLDSRLASAVAWHADDVAWVTI